MRQLNRHNLENNIIINKILHQLRQFAAADLILLPHRIAVAFMLLLMTGGMGAQPVAITLDASKPGRTFEGIGGVSAGASSRLLIDYPEPQRREILDYLFKPNYGAALQHLKVEIGGDVNSTDGVESSHMHTRADENYQRGYEWWLMKEAKKRNPNIILDCLAWGAPAWIGDGKYYSQDLADYVVKFIKGAKTVHGLEINYTGIANERNYDVAWIKLLRRTLDANGLNLVGIVAADQSEPDVIAFPAPPNQKTANPTIWDIAEEINKDTELKAAVAAIGGHYPFRHRETMSAAALASGLRLWSSEDGPWSGEWLATSEVSRLPLQASYNRNYIFCKITKTEVWSPITSYYDNLPIPGSGLLRANTPWSGHYEIQPAIWVTAHTTQFAHPGWKYLDSACLLLPAGGSCVALMAPNGRDYSIIVETSGAKEPQRLLFKLGSGLSNKSLHAWRTNAREQFQNHDDIVHRDKTMLEVNVEPDCVYSLTTTTGQRKGDAKPPPPTSFPLKYKEDFSRYPVGSTPKYWSDFGGVFEVVNRGDGKGKALRQVLEKPGIEWCPNPFPQSFCGEVSWDDYAIGAEVFIEQSGFISLFGRISGAGWSADFPQGYGLKVSDSGNWELLAAKTKLAGGKVPFSAGAWHQLKLSFIEDKITAIIDGNPVAEIKDNHFDHGNAGIGCGWHGAQFANITIDSGLHPKPLNLAAGKPASASSQWSEEFTAAKANDGDMSTRWNSAIGKCSGEWLEIDLGHPVSFNRTVIRQFDERITKYKIQYWNGGEWRMVVDGRLMHVVQRDDFSTITASKVRILIEETKAVQTPSIFEFGVFLLDLKSACPAAV